MTSIAHLLAALAIGACLSLQPPINAVMARTLGSPLLAAVVSIAISLVVVVPVWWTVGCGAGDFAQIRTLPWWVLLGGVIGVVFVAGMAYTLDWGTVVGLLGDYPRLLAYVQRMYARPQAAMRIAEAFASVGI